MTRSTAHEPKRSGVKIGGLNVGGSAGGDLTFGGSASVTSVINTPVPRFGSYGGRLSSTTANPQYTATPITRANVPIKPIIGGGASYFSGIGGTATWNGGGSNCGCGK